MKFKIKFTPVFRSEKKNTDTWNLFLAECNVCVCYVTLCNAMFNNNNVTDHFLCFLQNFELKMATKMKMKKVSLNRFFQYRWKSFAWPLLLQRTISFERRTRNQRLLSHKFWGQSDAEEKPHYIKVKPGEPIHLKLRDKCNCWEEAF